MADKDNNTGEEHSERDVVLEVSEQIRLFKEFIEQHYHAQLLEANRKGKISLVISFTDLLKFNTELAEELTERPEEVLKAAEIAIKEFDLPQKIDAFTVRVKNMPDSLRVNISEIRSKHLSKFMWCIGIVRQKSDVRPHVSTAKFECPSCGNVLTVLQLDQKYKEPTRCSCGRKGKFKELSKELVDGQGLVLEESPDDLDGAQPKRINVFLKGDLVTPLHERKSSPGTKVKLFGWVSEIPIQLRSGGKSTKYDLILEANHLEPFEDDPSNMKISDKDYQEIIKISEQENVLLYLANNIAPSIYGHDKIKQSLALQLAGGCVKKRKDGVRTRGDIHMLLIGDPGSGKSQLLKRMTRVAPKARFTSGKGASAAGLTASVVKDEFLGGWSLEAGTLVLANKGFAIIDELDKMTKDDRSALHEAMEQQSYHYDTELMMADGSICKIGELVDSLMNKNSQDVIQGVNCEILPKKLPLLSTDFNKVFPVKSDRISRHLAPKYFVKVSFSNGRSIKVTPEHPLFVFDKKIITVEAQKVKIGMLVPAPRKLDFIGEKQALEAVSYSSACKDISQPIELTNEFAEFLGYFATEGHSYYQQKNSYAEIGISNTETQINREVGQLMTSLFQTHININISAPTNRQYATLPLTTTRCSSIPLYRYFHKNFCELMKKSTTKRVPKLLRKSTASIRTSFLQKAYKGDGFIDSERFGYVSSSYGLAKDYQDLLLGIGIYSYIQTRKKRASMTVDAYKVVISGRHNMLEFINKIVDPKDKRYQKLISFNERSNLRLNDRDVIPKDIMISIKSLLNYIRLDDGNIGINLNRKVLLHHQNALKYLNLVTDKLSVLKKILNTDNSSIVRKEFCISVSMIAKTLGVSIATVYNKEKVNDKNVLLVTNNLAKKKYVNLSNKVESLSQLLHSNLRFHKITKVEKIPNVSQKWVYDVTVEPTHTFISEGLVLHNTVSVSKANIQATLTCETTLLAAANPKFGRFDPYDLIANQINLPPTLINRFDLIFPIKDLPGKEKDDKLATFILGLHQNPDAAVAKIESDILKKYFLYVRRVATPYLSDAAISEIKAYYINMRNSGAAEEGGVSSVPITARQLEALVRLAEASAKLRLAKIVTKDDALKSIELIDYCLNQIAKDTETGKIDIDRISSKITSTQRSKISMIKELITNIESATKERIISVELIIQEAANKKISSEDVEEVLEKLRRSGDIFEPKRGFIQKL